MRILFSIIINALILYSMTYLLASNPARGIEAGIVAEGGIQIYILGGIILGLINFFIRPILKILSLPLFFVFLGLVSLLINGIILLLFDYIINDILKVAGMTYSFVGMPGTINGWINFTIAVAIFTILNMFYSLLFSKK